MDSKNISNQPIERARTELLGKTYGYLKKLFDNGQFTELYPLSSDESENSGVICCYGNVEGKGAYAFAQDGGPVTHAQAEKIQKTYSLSLKTGRPIIGIYNSVGANLKDRNKIMNEYSRIISCCNRMSGVAPQISLVLDNCFGANAVAAVSSDIVIMSSDSSLGLNIGGEDGNLEFINRNGLGHIICESVDGITSYARKLIKMLPQNNLSQLPINDFEPPDLKYRLNQIKGSYNIIDHIFDKDSFIEFQSGFGNHFSAGITSLNGISVGIILSDINRSKTIDELSCSKASRLVRFCDNYSIPVITFVNAQNFVSLRGASKIISSYTEATTAKITVITGMSYGSVYIAFCAKDSSDITFSLPGTSISSLFPDTAVEIFYKDELKSDGINPQAHRKALVNMYKSKETSAIKAAKDGLIDDIIDWGQMRVRLYDSLSMIINKRESRPPKKHSNIQI